MAAGKPSVIFSRIYNPTPTPSLTLLFRWLIAHDRVDEANSILADLENKHIDHPRILTQSSEIQWAVQFERDNTLPWKDLLRGRTNSGSGGGNTCTLRRVILGMGVQAMQQLSGINVTSYYLPLVLIQSVGLSTTMARLLAACNSVSYLLFSLIGIPNVERWGRRKLTMCTRHLPPTPPPRPH